MEQEQQIEQPIEQQPKPKRKCSEKQLEALRKNREIRAQRYTELKEKAKTVDKNNKEHFDNINTILKNQKQKEDKIRNLEIELNTTKEILKNFIGSEKQTKQPKQPKQTKQQPKQQYSEPEPEQETRQFNYLF